PDSQPGYIRSMVCLISCSRSLCMQSPSGLIAFGSVICKGFVSSLGLSSNDTSCRTCLLRKTMSEELVQILVNHVENLDLPSNELKWMKARRKASWIASSASSQFPVTRYAQC